MKKKQITGTYEEVGGFGRVIPHERKEVKEVLILQGSELGAKPGDQVAVELLPEASYRGIKRRSGVADIGKVLEVLGGKNDVAAAEKALIRRLGPVSYTHLFSRAKGKSSFSGFNSLKLYGTCTVSNTSLAPIRRTRRST